VVRGKEGGREGGREGGKEKEVLWLNGSADQVVWVDRLTKVRQGGVDGLVWFASRYLQLSGEQSRHCGVKYDAATVLAIEHPAWFSVTKP
jgi:hypothetical protein